MNFKTPDDQTCSGHRVFFVTNLKNIPVSRMRRGNCRRHIVSAVFFTVPYVWGNPLADDIPSSHPFFPHVWSNPLASETAQNACRGVFETFLYSASCRKKEP